MFIRLRSLWTSAVYLLKVYTSRTSVLAFTNPRRHMATHPASEHPTICNLFIFGDLWCFLSTTTPLHRFLHTMAHLPESFGSERVVLQAIMGNPTLPTFTRAPMRKKKEKKARDVYNQEQPGPLKRLLSKIRSKLSQLSSPKEREPRIYFHLVRHAEVCSFR